MEVREACRLLGALLIGCHSNNGLFLFSFEHIKVDFHLLAVLIKTAQLNAHGRDCDVTPGNSSTHFPSAPSSLFFKQSSTILLDASAWPLPCGYLGVDKCCLMPYFARNAITSLSILRGVLAHGRPEVAYAESLLGKQSAPSVISTLGSCQLGSSSIYIKFGCSASSMLGWSRCSIGIERLNWVSSADPKLASASACEFSARGTCWMVKVGNAFNNSWTLSRYKIILGCFAMYSPEA
ncbi:hypothetical protein ACE6H2_006957 [Prunus campanulata]